MRLLASVAVAAALSAVPAAPQGRFALPLPTDDFSPTILDSGRWIEAPTGKHGIVTVRGERFVFSDGTPVRFWGAQLDLFSKEKMDYVVRRLRKQGINLVRMHGLNFLNRRGGDSILDYNAEAFDRFDYAIAALGRNGIYIILDTDYPLTVPFGPKDAVPGLEKGATQHAEFFNSRIAQLKQQRMRDVFTHVNPYTKKRIADDPTLAAVEVHNEDSMFWYSVDALKEPFKSELRNRYRAWLEKKYGKPAGDAELIPIGSFRPQYFAAHAEQKQRAADQLRFYLELETTYFNECRRILREIGVKVPVSGTNWQGGGFTTRVHMLGQSGLDYVDRHGYWDHPQGEGNSKWQVKTCKFLNLPMMKSLQTGNDPQQENNVGNLVVSKAWERVFGLPMTISEWNTCHPNEYSLEGTGVMAAYGLMQGWSGSLQFAYSSADWGATVANRSFDVVGNPPQVLQFPAVAAMWYRGDVREADIAGEIAYNGDSIYDLANDRLSAPMAAALIGKVGYNFGKASGKRIDAAKYWDEGTRTARSVTGELEWDAGKGVVTIDTPRTQAAIGFLSERRRQLQSVSLETTARFGAVYVTALDEAKPIRTARRLLVTVVGPTRNTGMEYETTSEISGKYKVPLWRVKSFGTGPVLMDAIEGKLRIRNDGAAALVAWALDVNGKRTGKVPLERTAGAITLTLSAADAAVYYEIGDK
jgi:hypothetical protein